MLADLATVTIVAMTLATSPSWHAMRNVVNPLAPDRMFVQSPKIRDRKHGLIDLLPSLLTLPSPPLLLCDLACSAAMVAGDLSTKSLHEDLFNSIWNHEPG